jgi:hypothetical protein
VRRILRKVFGRSAPPRKGPTRPTARPALEQLDERVLPSTTGVVSQVEDVHGNSVAFYIDNNHNLWASVNGGQAAGQIDNAGVDLQVSAGLDRYGLAVAYVQNSAGHSLWALHVAFSGGYVWETFGQYIDSNVSNFSALMGRNPVNGQGGGVFYVGGRYGGTNLFQDDQGSYQISGAGGDAISAGTDTAGNGVVYETAHWVYRYSYQTALWEFAYNGGQQWGLTTIAGNDFAASGNNVGYQVAGSINGIVYFTDSADGADMYDGTFRLIGAHVVQISSGTDFWGNSTLDFMHEGADSTVTQFVYQNGGAGYYTVLWGNGNQDYIAAGQGGYDYYVDEWYDTLTERYASWYVTGGWGNWQWQYGVTQAVIGYNVL